VSFKAVYLTSPIKNPELDALDVRSYRLIFHLSVVSKLLERLVARQFIVYMKQHDLLPKLLSAYLSGHPT
jgi:hypothetical protein